MFFYLFLFNVTWLLFCVCVMCWVLCFLIGVCVCACDLRGVVSASVMFMMQADRGCGVLRLVICTIGV